MSSNVEAVEKVPKQIFGRDAEKNDLTECATINDLMLGKGQVSPENIDLTRQKDFCYRLVRPNKRFKNMSLAEYLKFAFFFTFIIIYIAVAYLGTFHTEWILKTAVGKFIYRNAIPRQMRIFSAIFLTAGLLFLGGCLWQLSIGTFKWIGNPKTYSFADFLK